MLNADYGCRVHSTSSASREHDIASIIAVFILGRNVAIAGVALGIDFVSTHLDRPVSDQLHRRCASLML